MGNIKGWGLRRTEVFFMRLTKQEKKILRSKSKNESLTMVEYVRCKTYDIPFEQMSGRLKMKKAKTENNSTAQKSTIPIA